MDLPDVVKSVSIFAEAEVDGTNIVKLTPGDDDDDVTDAKDDAEVPCGQRRSFFVKEYYYNGDCYALKIPDCLREVGVLEIVMDFHNKTDIFIHHAGQFLSPNSR